MAKKLRVRRNIVELQHEYDSGNKKPLEDLMRAWKAIKELPPDDPRSFYTLGGYHGEPFRGGGWSSAMYWGGYCNHGNVLFPTWHRVYLLKLEEALRSVDGCGDVTLPFWDETGEESRDQGIPWALTRKEFTLDGETIPNPLRSFVFPRQIVDHINGDNPNYSKHEGYETVRYPLSGLVGTERDRAATAAHNARYPNYDENVDLLNSNIVNWLTAAPIVNGKPITGHVAKMYQDCLDAPNYTVFSNTTSAQQWNDDHVPDIVVALESPHNKIHLAVGGFDVPKVADYSPIKGANGDMGENDTAGLDPIFFFHHCFVDRVFWLWQQRHGATDRLEIIDEYPGTNSVDGQFPTPGTIPNSWLTLDSPLDPFKKQRKKKGKRPYTSRDCINIEEQLGYTYGPGSLEEHAEMSAAPASAYAKAIHVGGVNRAPIRGSFVVAVYGEVDGEQVCLGTEAVLSRWSVQGCANCQTHLETKAFVGLEAHHADLFDESNVSAKIHTRDDPAGEDSAGAASGRLDLLAADRRPFYIEVR